MTIDTNVKHYYAGFFGNEAIYDECCNNTLPYYPDSKLEYRYYADNLWNNACRNGKSLLQAEMIKTPKVKEVKVEEKLVIKKVIFSDPATIVLWSDGTKTVVKTQKGDPYDPEKGLAMACMKKMLSKKDYHKHLEEAQQIFIKLFRDDVLDVLEKTQLNPLHIDPSPEFR